MNSVNVIKKHTEIDELALETAICSLYNELISNDTSVIQLWPDAKETLRVLTESSIKIYLTANEYEAVQTGTLLQRLGIAHFFSEIVTLPSELQKPDPSVVGHFLSRTSIHDQELLVVSASLYPELHMANAAQVRSCWVNILDHSSNPTNTIPTEGIVCLAQLPHTITYLNTVTPSPTQFQVGYYLSNLRKKLEAGKIGFCLSTKDLRYIPIEFIGPLDCLPALHCIFHKATNLLVLPDQSHIENLVSYLSSHPETILIDPIEPVRALTNRVSVYQSLPPCIAEGPYSLRLPHIYTSSPIFPCIVKSTTACQVQGSHQMAIVFTPNGLSEALTHHTQPILQEWTRHIGGVHKIYSINSSYSETQGHSIDIFSITSDIIWFDSQRNWAAELPTQIDESVVPPELLAKVLPVIHSSLSVGILGLDVLQESPTSYVLIDVNYFPSFTGYPEFCKSLDSYIISKLMALS